MGLFDELRTQRRVSRNSPPAGLYNISLIRDGRQESDQLGANRIQVRPAAVADRVGLQEPRQVGGVHARLVVVEAELGDPLLAGVLEPNYGDSNRNSPFQARGAGLGPRRRSAKLRPLCRSGASTHSVL